MNNHQQQNQHLWWRAGFGPPVDRVSELAKQKPQALFRSILEASEKKPLLFDVADPGLKEMVMGSREMTAGRLMNLKPEEKKMIRRQSVLDIAKLNIRWMQEMRDSQAQLLEKMSLFWHGHFATKTVNILFDQELLNIIRTHALGNFRELLGQVSKSASMIQFLNNNQNRKSHPNENFARELMELFTLGTGHYTETDIKESARAFTGWGTTFQGQFDFRPRQHDDGMKTFFGKKGNFTGEDILEIILEQKQTAVFITKKIYRFFVNEMVDEEIVTSLAKEFFDSGYEIKALMSSIFQSTWFFNTANIGSQIKSPVLWMVGMQRQLPMKLNNPNLQVVMGRLLGQVLFAPPNVAGWPGGKHWIDSSSLMLRLQIPQLFYRADALTATPKDDDDLMMGRKNSKLPFFQADIIWEEYLKNFDRVSDPDLYSAIRKILLQRDSPLTENNIAPFIQSNGRTARIESTSIRLMSTPEYQLC